MHHRAPETVIACAAIESRSTSTLVLVDRKALADQWRDRISSHLSFACGQIGGGRSKTTGILDIALLPTLARRDNVEDITASYGFVIVDECHHVAASAFFGVLSRIAARYWLGLTATPERRDGLEDLIYHQLGSHHVAIEPPSTGQLPVDGSDLLTPHPVLHLHPTEFQYRGDADPTAPGGMAEIYRALVADRTRLEQIVDDVLTASETGANILVLTTWVEHLNAITDRLQAAGRAVTVLSGGIKARERRQIADQLANRTPDSDPLLIVGTSSFIGEGFDCPALDTREHPRVSQAPFQRHAQQVISADPRQRAAVPGERSTHPRLGRRPHSSSTATAGPMAIGRPDDAGAHTSRPGSMSASDARRDSISSLL